MSISGLAAGLDRRIDPLAGGLSLISTAPEVGAGVPEPPTALLPPALPLLLVRSKRATAPT